MNVLLKFKKPALAGGLLLVFVIGLANLPDLALRFYPDAFLRGQSHLAHRNIIRMHERLDKDEATLAVLNHAREHGLVHCGECPYPAEAGVKQVTRRMEDRQLEDYGELADLDYMQRRLEALLARKAEVRGP